MTPERWSLLKEHLGELLPLSADARDRYLDSLSDVAVREELREFLQQSVAADDGRAPMPRWSLPAGATLPPGTAIGPYRLVSLLGAGGMGIVYRARDERLGRDVAIKVLPSTWVNASDRVSRFAREARAASALNHPNILTVHDVVTTEHGHAIVTELVDGETLATRIARGPSPPADAVGIVLQVTRALAAAHAAGIVHRDVKPANIMVRVDGVVKLLDFGIAKHSIRPHSSADGTGTLGPIGTVRYMSPEQAQGLTVDHRSDVFSLGIVLFELLTGTTPFQGRTTTETLLAIVRDAAAPLPHDVPGLSVRLGAILDRALEKSPAARYQTARELADALEAALAHGHATTAVGLTPRRPAMPVAVGGLLLLGASVGIWSLATGPSSLVDRAPQTPTAADPPAPARTVQDVPAPRPLPGLRWIAIPGTAPEGDAWQAVFEMGCIDRDTACDVDERPRHAVTLTRPYALMETEVTRAQYAAYLQATGAPMPPPPHFEQSDDHPVVGVSWAEATAFCTWVGGRLPTEAEWEYAARGGLPNQIYSWGTSSATSHGNFRGIEDGHAFTAPVGQYARSRFGLRDLYGNVWEWVADWYGIGYANGPVTDPRGPTSGDRRVLRGDSWNNPRKNGRLSDRGRNSPDYRLAVYGIRCALDVDSPP